MKKDFKKYNKDSHFILIKGTIYQEEITIINIHAPTVGIPNFIKQTLPGVKAQINPSTIVYLIVRQVTQTKNQQKNFRIQ
jgi:hypothetical protein